MQRLAIAGRRSELLHSKTGKFGTSRRKRGKRKPVGSTKPLLDCKESLRNVKESLLDCKESSRNVKEPLLDCKEPSRNIKESLRDCKEPSRNVKESSGDCKEALRNDKEAFLLTLVADPSIDRNCVPFLLRTGAPIELDQIPIG
jgi:hypothetical protein